MCSFFSVHPLVSIQMLSVRWLPALLFASSLLLAALGGCGDDSGPPVVDAGDASVDGGVDAGDAVEITEVRGFHKFDSLLPHYLYWILFWKEQEHLRYLGAMINTIKIFRVRVPWDLNRLGEVHDYICRHSREI